MIGRHYLPDLVPSFLEPQYIYDTCIDEVFRGLEHLHSLPNGAQLQYNRPRRVPTRARRTKGSVINAMKRTRRLSVTTKRDMEDT
jgi:hypothetical protein